MHRPRLALGFLLAPIIISLAFFTVGCAGKDPTLDNFFRASRMGDNPTLSNISMVAFSPKTEGIVEGYAVTTAGEERVEPLQLKELAKAYEEARQADEEFTKRKLAYQDEHGDELKAFEEARQARSKPRGKLSAEFQATWNKWVEDTKTSAKRVSEARQKLNTARAIADVSVMNPQEPVDPTQYDGELATKDMTIAANIITPEGQKVKKTLVVTMQQARLKGDKPIIGKWIITAIKDEAGGKTS